jgi:hypothetical protein
MLNFGHTVYTRRELLLWDRAVSITYHKAAVKEHFRDSRLAPEGRTTCRGSRSARGSNVAYETRARVPACPLNTLKRARRTTHRYYRKNKPTAQ